jgi:hypothetical protein
MTKFEVGARVYHTKMGYGIVVPIELCTRTSSRDRVCVRFDVPTCGDGYYLFNSDGTHQHKAAVETLGVLSLVEDLIPVPDEWYKELVE